MKISVKNGESIQSAINAATSGDVVSLGEGTFNLSSGHITMKSNIILEGSGRDKTIIKATSVTGGVSGANNPDGWVYCNDIDNFEIRNLGFTSDAKGIADGGHGEARNCFYMNECTNAKVSNCKVFKYVYSDFVKCRAGRNIIVENCVGQCGHDFVQFLKCIGCEARNLDVTIQTNTGVRLYQSSNCKVTASTFTAPLGSGWCAIELQSTQNNNTVDRCIIHDMHGSTGNYAVQFLDASGSVSVTNCVYWNCSGFIRGGSAQQSGNIDGSSNASVDYWTKKGYGYQTTSQGATISETPIKVDFISNVTSGEAPLRVTFTDISVGEEVTEWMWEMGNGLHSKHPKTATYTFREPGTYDISLTINGKHKLVKPGFIVVRDDNVGPVIAAPEAPVKPQDSRARSIKTRIETL